MREIVQCLREMRRKRILMWALIIIPMLAVVFCLMTDFEWMGSTGEEFSGYDHVPYALATVKCPAQRGLRLTDYWRCLFRTSITAQGWQQHRQIKTTIYQERLREEHEETMERQKLRRSSNETLVPKKRRVRRQTNSPLFPFNPNDVSTHFLFQKMRAFTSDLYFLDDTRYPLAQNITFPSVRQCQLKHIWPGVSIRRFIRCLQEIMLDWKEDETVKKTLEWYGYYETAGHSLHSTFQPTTFPPMHGSEYDGNEFRVVSRNYTNNASRTFTLQFDFKPLKDEERLDNFEGADAFLEDNFSPYRYRFNNLNPSQHPTAWSYRGASSSSDWHEIPLHKFFVPLSSKVPEEGDIKKEFLHEMLVSYPGLGELMEGIKATSIELGKNDTFLKQMVPYIASPLDHTWKKDSGEHAYTRFLIPLLDQRDVTYYRSNGFEIPDNPPDEIAVLINLFNSLWTYQLNTFPASLYHAENLKYEPSKFYFYDSYLEFIQHYFDVDIAKWINLKAEYGNTSVVEVYNQSDHKFPYLLSMDLDVVRKVLSRYVDVVLPQVGCLYYMVKLSNGRRLSQTELDEMIEGEMKKMFIRKDVVDNLCRLEEDDKAILELEPHKWFRLPIDTLGDLYNSYFDRKEARQRYSIPSFPKEFPICRSQDPSPIDIQTKQTRQSMLKDYSFGRGAYRLNRFFMFLPLDGSPLLTLGIVDGQRLDDSSVKLSGGAVKGENLTFQYMHIRFADSWDKIGSEHWIDGKGATMEIQSVFTIAGSADSVKYWHVLARVMNQLFQFRDKLVIVLSVLVDVLETDEAVRQKIENEELNQDPLLFEPLAQAAYHFHSMPAKHKGFEEPRGYVSEDPVFRFIDYFPRVSSKFYTYRGSLTWPPCFPYVIWSVFDKRLYMSKRQFDQFAAIPAYGVEGHSTYASNNFRRFEDIYVSAESDVSYETKQKMMKARTKDRHILVGIHDVHHEGKLHEGDGIVGNEMYYMEWHNSASTFKPTLFVLLAYLCIVA